MGSPGPPASMARARASLSVSAASEMSSAWAASTCRNCSSTTKKQRFAQIERQAAHRALHRRAGVPGVHMARRGLADAVLERRHPHMATVEADELREQAQAPIARRRALAIARGKAAPAGSDCRPRRAPTARRRRANCRAPRPGRNGAKPSLGSANSVFSGSTPSVPKTKRRNIALSLIILVRTPLPAKVECESSHIFCEVGRPRRDFPWEASIVKGGALGARFLGGA